MSASPRDLRNMLRATRRCQRKGPWAEVAYHGLQERVDAIKMLMKWRGIPLPAHERYTPRAFSLKLIISEEALAMDTRSVVVSSARDAFRQLWLRTINSIVSAGLIGKPTINLSSQQGDRP